MNYDYNTGNKSFLEVSKALSLKNINNDKFMLELLDDSLSEIDPFDLTLKSETKQKIIAECMYNYWYFLRECTAASGYKLTTDSLKVQFAMVSDLDIITGMEFMYDIAYRILWEFLFRPETNTGLIDKTFIKAKFNLELIRTLYNTLPSYLKELSGKNNIISNSGRMENKYINSSIRTSPVGRTKENAFSVAKSFNSPRQWFNDFINIPFAQIILNASNPGHCVSRENARRWARPYGMIITADLNIDFPDKKDDIYHPYCILMDLKESSVNFISDFYSYSKKELENYIIEKGHFGSSFVFI